MRLTDADALIDDIRDRYCKDCNKRKGIKRGKYRIIYEIGEAPCKACGVGDMLDELENAPTANVHDTNAGKWIPCSERLPDKEGRYLCTMGAEFHPVREMIYEPDEFISEEDRNTWRSIDGLHVFNWFVKAWMPMPKPYKMDEVEDGLEGE